MVSSATVLLIICICLTRKMNATGDCKVYATWLLLRFEICREAFLM